jgi:aryl-alcohol dehydrogenase-like predicted oxidoreductase
MADMPIKRLGNSGLKVSRLALGAMTFGARTEEAEARQIIAAAAEAGINFIDTADTYAGGRSEEIVGRAIAADRSRWILATKLYNPNGPGPNDRGLSRRWILSEAHASLKRLQIDTIDILYLHKEDPGTPLEETVRAVRDLQRSGAIRYFGLSNFRSWRIARIYEMCLNEGMDPPIVHQPVYHVLNRSAEIEVLPACAAMGIGVFAYSPTARGVLSGKYAIDAPPPADSRAGQGDKRILGTEYRPDVLKAAQQFASYARERGADPIALAIAWVLGNPIMTGAIVGPRTMEQFRTYLKAVEVSLSDADEAWIDELVNPGNMAAHPFIDPNYPIEGRPKQAPARPMRR